jgi:hypothetical protein
VGKFCAPLSVLLLSVCALVGQVTDASVIVTSPFPTAIIAIIGKTTGAHPATSGGVGMKTEKYRPETTECGLIQHRAAKSAKRDSRLEIPVTRG